MFANFNKIVLIVMLISVKSYSQDSKVDSSPLVAKPNIQIKVDANTYNFNQNDNSVTSTKSNSNDVEIKDIKDSNITTELSKDKTTETTIQDSQVTTKESTQVIKESTASEENKVSSPEVITDSTVEKNIEANTVTTKEKNTDSKNETKIESTEVTSEQNTEVTTKTEINAETANTIVAPVTEVNNTSDIKNVDINDVEIKKIKIKDVDVKGDVIITEPTPEVIEEPTPEIVDETKPETPKHSLPFYIRGTLGYGLFTSIDDISSNYSLGFAVGHDFNHHLSIEFQYLFSEFEDNYNYGNYYGVTIDGYTFSQNDIAVLLNYKVISNKDFSVHTIGGLNYAMRSSKNSSTFDTNTSNSFSAVLGLGADFRLNKNLFFTTNFNYNLNLTSSGYNSTSSPLYLASGEDYINFNFGLKYKF